jgi:hypothetical protein
MDNSLLDNCDTLNQRCPANTTPSKMNDEHAAVSNLASSANFGIRDQAKDTKSVNNSNEKKKFGTNNVNASNNYSLEYSEHTEITKKCDYIDQYVNYKNGQKPSDISIML